MWKTLVSRKLSYDWSDKKSINIKLLFPIDIVEKLDEKKQKLREKKNTMKSNVYRIIFVNGL